MQGGVPRARRGHRLAIVIQDNELTVADAKTLIGKLKLPDRSGWSTRRADEAAAVKWRADESDSPS